MMNGTIWKILGFAVILALASACGRSAERTSKEVAKKNADVSLKAAELSRAFEDPKQGDRQYRGKILRVTGKVGFLGEEKMTVNGKEKATKVLDFQIVVKTPSDQAPEHAKDFNDAIQKGVREGVQHIRLGVRCSFPQDQEAALATLKKGDRVTVKGKCVGKTLLGMGPVGLKGCVIL